MKPDNKPIAYDTFQADVKQRKSKVWVKMLADEPVERLLAAKRTDES